MGVYYNRQCRNRLEHRKEPKPPPEVDAGVGGATFASLFFKSQYKTILGFCSVFGSEDKGVREAQDMGHKKKSFK